MQSEDIAPAVRELIHRHVRSMDHAEALLHLLDAPQSSHTVEAISARHHWARGVAARVLRDLEESGIAVASNGGFMLANVADADTLAGLERLYHRHPVTLVRAIYSAPMPIKPLVRPVSSGGDSSPQA